MGKKFKTLQGLTRISTDAESSGHKDKKPLHLAESEQQNPETDVKKGKGIKRCSTATDAESSDHKDKKPLQITESELENPETDVKKQKKRRKKSEIKEMKKLRKSCLEMTETMKNLQDYFMGKDIPGFSMKEMLLSAAPNTSSMVEEPLKKAREEYECCFKTEDGDGVDHDGIFVKGFDTSLSREDIKSALKKHFEAGGLEVTRVFVPIECKTGARLGFAFVDVDDNDKALELGGDYLGGSWFLVMLAESKTDCFQCPNFMGCEHCGSYYWERRAKRFLARPWR